MRRGLRVPTGGVRPAETTGPSEAVRWLLGEAPRQAHRSLRARPPCAPTRPHAPPRRCRSEDRVSRLGRVLVSNPSTFSSSTAGHTHGEPRCPPDRRALGRRLQRNRLLCFRLEKGCAQDCWKQLAATAQNPFYSEVPPALSSQASCCEFMNVCKSNVALVRIFLFTQGLGRKGGS